VVCRVYGAFLTQLSKKKRFSLSEIGIISLERPRGSLFVLVPRPSASFLTHSETTRAGKHGFSRVECRVCELRVVSRAWNDAAVGGAREHPPEGVGVSYHSSV
jgi:hypothetical protein